MNKKINRKINRNISLDYVCTFLTNLNMQSSIWVLYLAYCGMDLLQIGILEGIYHATSILCEIPSGALVDLVGRKKSMILGKVCITASYLLMLFGREFWLFALSFMVQALGNNFNSGSEEALVYDSMLYLKQEDRYIKISGRLNMIIEVAQAAATVIGGVMAEYSYVMCYCASAIISILAFIPVLLMSEPPVQDKSEGANKRSGFKMVLRHFELSFKLLTSDLRILKIVVCYSVIFAAHTLLFFYSQQYYFDLGYNKIYISLIMLFAGIASCLEALFSENLYKKLQNKTVLFSTMVIASALICYGLKRAVLSIVIFIISSFFHSSLYPVESASLNRLIPSEQRATLISVNSMFFSIVMIATFPIAGAMADYWSLPLILMSIGGLLLFFVLGCHKFLVHLCR